MRVVTGKCRISTTGGGTEGGGEAERTGILHIPTVFSLVRVRVCTCEYKHLDICNRGLFSKAS